MIQSLDSSNSPDLESFPSAGLHDSEIDVSSGNSGFGKKLFWLIFRLLVVVFVLAAIALGALYFIVSSGPISNEQVRLQVESQLSSLLGDGHSARIGEANVEIGKGGLIALDAKDIKILAGNHINLGVASSLGVSVKALPLLQGEVVAETITLANAAISLDNILQLPALAGQSDETTTGWPTAIDGKKRFGELYQVLEKLTASIEATGIEKIERR